jgi:Flp pilus assembly pilin Flp
MPQTRWNRDGANGIEYGLIAVLIALALGMVVWGHM